MEKIYKYLKLFLSFILYLIAIPLVILAFTGASLLIAAWIAIYIIILPFIYVYYRIRKLPMPEYLQEVDKIVKDF